MIFKDSVDQDDLITSYILMVELIMFYFYLFFTEIKCFIFVWILVFTHQPDTVDTAKMRSKITKMGLNTCYMAEVNHWKYGYISNS